MKHFIFIGVDQNTQLASYTFEVLSRQLQRDRKKYVKTLHTKCSLTTKRRRADLFADHWVMAVYKIINEFAQCEASLAMVDEYIDKHYATKTMEYKPKTQSKRFDSARNAGYQAGKNAQLHRPVNNYKEDQLAITFEGATLL